jgi:hypothetical protein
VGTADNSDVGTAEAVEEQTVAVLLLPCIICGEKTCRLAFRVLPIVLFGRGSFHCEYRKNK